MLGAHFAHIITGTQKQNLTISLDHNEKLCMIRCRYRTSGIIFLYHYQLTHTHTHTPIYIYIFSQGTYTPTKTQYLQREASKHNADLVKKQKGSAAESGPRCKMDRCCLDGGNNFFPNYIQCTFAQITAPEK